jgi:predicted RNase H-like HicB family nuclease
MEYKMALQRTEEGFSLFCPGLPGCWSQGATEEEALENIREAIREYLAAQAVGHVLPRPYEMGRTCRFRLHTLHY